MKAIARWSSKRSDPSPSGALRRLQMAGGRGAFFRGPEECPSFRRMTHIPFRNALTRQNTSRMPDPAVPASGFFRLRSIPIAERVLRINCRPGLPGTLLAGQEHRRRVAVQSRGRWLGSRVFQNSGGTLPSACASIRRLDERSPDRHGRRVRSQGQGKESRELILGGSRRSAVPFAHEKGGELHALRKRGSDHPGGSAETQAE